jgi:hypothetical protein
MEIKEIAYQSLFNSLSKNDTQNVFTPSSLVRIILKRIKFNSESKIFVWYNIEFLVYLVKELGLSSKNIYIYTNSQDKLILQKQGYNICFQKNIDFNKLDEQLVNMQFDVVLGNPPYQIKVGDKKTEPIWNKFFHKSLSLLKEGGYMSLIHPSGWRNIEGKFSDVKDIIKKKKLHYLSINNEKKGMEIFGAETRFDYYLLENTVNDGVLTEITFQDGTVDEVDLSNIDFIPNGSLSEVQSLIAQEGEEKVDLLYSRSSYGTDKSNVSKVQENNFIHPCVYTVNYLSQPTFHYSSTNENGHFGIPKVIWSNGRISSVGSYIDETGEFALTQFAYAIADEVENLPNIKRALDSIKFKKLMELCAVGQLTINHKVISTFRKDFWREFIDD